MALAYGSRGNDVLEYQKKMKTAGIDPGPLDGIWGNKTEAANKTYQASMSQASNKLSTQNGPPSGLIGLRSTAEGMGANVGWSPETGATINGGKVDTSGLQNFGNRWYGTPEQIYGMMATTPAPEHENTMFDQNEISGLIYKILNPGKFTYDKNTDPAYQSLLTSATANGEKAFNNNIADLTSLTGGRLNSWAAGQASQARTNEISQADAQIPNLYQLAYGMYQDKQNQNTNALNTLLGMDETSYNRSRDSYGDFKANVNTALGLEDQDYQRGVDTQNYNRGVLESDRSFNRGTLESDRTFNYNKTLNEEAKTASTPPTTEQLATYNKMLASLSQNGLTPAENLKKIGDLPKTIVGMIGEDLYGQLLENIQSGLYAKAPEAASPMVDSPYYSAGMSQMKSMQDATVTDEVKHNEIPKYTAEEISQMMYDWIDNQSISPDQKAELANALGL